MMELGKVLIMTEHVHDGEGTPFRDDEIIGIQDI